MAEANIIAVMLKALSPISALLLGLCLGGTVVIFSRLILQTRGTTGKARSLHIELVDVGKTQKELIDTRAEVDDYAPALQANSRRWLLEEVWIDEGMGID